MAKIEGDFGFAVGTEPAKIYTTRSRVVCIVFKKLRQICSTANLSQQANCAAKVRFLFEKMSAKGKVIFACSCQHHRCMYNRCKWEKKVDEWAKKLSRRANSKGIRSAYECVCNVV